MKSRKTLAIIFAMLSVFMIAGIAAAQNQVAVSVTSEPIRNRAECDKAGGFSLQFDSNTVLTVGDVITIDTDLYTTLCRNIDIELSDGGSATPWTGANVMGNLETDAIYYEDEGADADLATTGTGIYFRIKGNAGSQRITVSVLGAAGSALTVGNDPADILVVKFLDQDTVFNDPGIYYALPATPTVYDQATDLQHNTLCIDISNPLFLPTVVLGHMDSATDKFTFIPSNPEIAHIIPDQAYSFYVCKDQECGDVVLGSRTSSQAGNAESCPGFDNEEEIDYCQIVDVHNDNNMIIRRTDDNFEVDTYNIRLTILVNGEEGENGVYFAAEQIEVLATDNTDDACAADDVDTAALGTTYYEADGDTVSPDLEAANDCDVAADARAVEALTVDAGMGITSAGQDLLVVNIPEMEYDLDEVEDGDLVTIKVELTRAPCGELFTGTMCVGTLVDTCPVAAQQITAGKMLYPYFTAMGVDTWWDGIVVDNLTSTAGTYTATIYEKDGDVGSYTSASIPARSQDVKLLSTILSVATKTSGAGVLGDSTCYIEVSTAWGAADGFAMIGSSANSVVDGSETMGYLPRTTGEYKY